MIIRRLAVLSLVLLLVAGCNRSKTSSTSVTVHDSGKAGQSAVTITGQNGEKMTINSEGTKLPDDYPKDVPVASGAKIVMATSVDDQTTHGSHLVLESTDSLEHVLAFYKKGLADNGWKINTTVSQPEVTVIAAEKGTRELSLSVQQSDGKCTVTQSVVAKN